MFIRTQNTDTTTDEYGGRFRRIYPWDAVAVPPWGSAFMTIKPGTASDAHSHDEEETFVILAGSGVVHVDGVSSEVGKGDVIYLPRFSEHFVENAASSDLEFLCIWWGAPTSKGEEQ